MRARLYILVSVLLLVGSVSISTGQTLLFSVRGGGRQVGGQFGRVVAVLGDVNSDGVPDLAAGQPDLGRVVVFSGAAGTRLRTLRSPSPQPFANFGAALAGVGDVNDDGVPDLAVGVPFQDLQGADCCDHGQVVVFSGADGTPLYTLQAPSPQPGANFGAALAVLGNVNDDGVPDLAVGAPGQDLEGVDCCDHGQVVVFSGAAGTPLYTLQAPSPQPFANFGAALAGVGDVNGDSVPDLAVGAPFQDVGCCDEGAVFIFSGADGAPLHTLQAPSPQGGAVFGATLASVGDVNGDGVPDLAVGAPFQDAGDCCGDEGAVFLFSGATGSWLLTLQAPFPQPFANFGAAVAGVGDVNGDDVPDLAVGTPGTDVEGCCNQGAVFLFSGADGPRLRTLRDPSPQAGANFGAAVVRMGDVNGDGVPDLAVGAPGQGAVFLFSGADGSRLRTLRDPSPQAGANFGATLVGMGDVDGDGVPDFAVGAPGQDVGSCCDQGQVVVFSGADGTRLHTLRSPSPQPFANFGAALAGVGDVNGDGVPDLAAGAPLQDVGSCCDHGQVVVFSGADGTPLYTLQAPSPQGGAVFGAALAAVGDVNDDGVPDLAVGAPGQDLEGRDCCDHGQVVVFSGADGNSLRTLRASRPQPGATFGAVLANAGDVNGDGVPDLAIGVPNYDRVDLFDQGQVVVISGATGSLLHTLQDRSLHAGGQFGRAIAGVGDVNDDGVPDLAVGAPLRDVESCCDQGQVVVFSGVTGTPLLTLPLRPQPGAFFGTALAGMGDVNGDGVPDLAVSAPGQDVRGLGDLGQVFVFSVATSP